MSDEFKPKNFKDTTVYTLESASSGGTSAGSVATVSKPLGKDQIVMQSRNGPKETPKPRNFVAKNAKMGGAGQHKDKKKADKQGEVKHRKPFAESSYNYGFADPNAPKLGASDQFRNRERNAGLEHEQNNIQIYINGKPWKVIPGKGYADSPEEWKYLDNMKTWAAKKSAATGKKWTVSLTGAPLSEDHSDMGKGWGQGSQATAYPSSALSGAGHDDRTMENPDWYNDEANSMTTAQLKSLVKHASKLRAAVKAMGTDTLEPWQQAKVTKAADYLDAVFNAVDDEHDMGEGSHPDEKEDKALIRKMVKQQALKQEDSYMAELFDKLAEKIPANAPVDRWIKDFDKASKTPNAKGHHQFKNKSPDKVRQMAIAASYGAKNPKKKK